MNIAVAKTDGEQISSHFGRSPFFAIYKMEESKIVEKTLRENKFTNHFKQSHERHSHNDGHHDHPHHGHGDVYEGLKDCQVENCRGMATGMGRFIFQWDGSDYDRGKRLR